LEASVKINEKTLLHTQCSFSDLAYLVGNTTDEYILNKISPNINKLSYHEIDDLSTFFITNDCDTEPTW